MLIALGVLCRTPYMYSVVNYMYVLKLYRINYLGWEERADFSVIDYS